MFDVVIECTGKLDGWQEACARAAPGGQVLLFGGLPRGTIFSVDSYRLHYEEIRILGDFHFSPRDVALGATTSSRRFSRTRPAHLWMSSPDPRQRSPGTSGGRAGTPIRHRPLGRGGFRDMTGIEAFLDVLAAAGVGHLFGNPGTTELPLNDALADDRRFRYIFGLHEIPVVAMADGYALASGSVGVVNVHICCGLGNAMGMLYNAHCARHAAVADRRPARPPPASRRAGPGWRPGQRGPPVDQVGLEVQRVEDIPTATRRRASRPP